MIWVDLIGATAVAAALLVIPGLPTAAVAGLRGAWLVGAAVPMSATVLTVGAVVAPRLGLDWGLVAVAVAAAGLFLVAAVCRFALRRWWDLGPIRVGVEWVTIAAAGLAGAVLAVRLSRALNDPENVSQTYDSIFHLNAVRWIIDTGDASPASVADMNSNTSTFYPAGFHGLAALVMRLGAVDLPVAVNATWLALCVVAWPLGAVLLTRALVGARRAVLLGAGASAAALAAFPALLVEYGVLYPLLAAYAVLPAVLAFSVKALGVGAGEDGPGPDGSRESGRLRLPWFLLTTAALPGVLLMHPTAMASWLALTTVWVLLVGWRLVQAERRTLRIVGVVGSLVWVLGAVAGILVLRPPEAARTWPPVGTMGQSLGEVLTLSVYLGSISIVASVLAWTGVVRVVRGRDRWEPTVAALSGIVVVGGLYVVVAGVSNIDVRNLVTGSWYSNTPRIAALLPMVVVPVAALGVAWWWDALRSRRPLRGLLAQGGPVALVTTLAVLGVLTLLLQGRAVSLGFSGVGIAYQSTDDARLISTDERALLERLDETVPEEAVVAGSPWTGTSLAYALADREVLLPHILVDTTSEMTTVIEELRDAEAGDEVCDAAERTGVEYVLDFGPREVQDIGPHPYPGLERLASSDAFELVDREGGARLYRLVACD